ncbi:unnamed protein product [Calypogeia fissa]
MHTFMDGDRGPERGTTLDKIRSERSVDNSEKKQRYLLHGDGAALHANAAFFSVFGSICEGNTLADIGAGQIEFMALTLRTQHTKYVRKVITVIQKLKEIFPADSLVPICISPQTGKPTNNEVSFGARGGSFYANLLKLWILRDKAPFMNLHEDLNAGFRDMWEQSMEGLLSGLVRKSAPPSSFAYIPEQRLWGGVLWRFALEEEACFAAGMLARGADGPHASPAKEAQYLQTADELAKTCYSFYFPDESGLTHMRGSFYLLDGDQAPLSMHASSPLRIKTVESLFHLWRKTGDDKYRCWAWDIFQKLNRELQAGPPAAMDSHFLANTLKYMYLFYSPSSVMPLDEWVFNSEGHPIKIRARPPPARKTRKMVPVMEVPMELENPSTVDDNTSFAIFEWTIENFSNQSPRKHSPSFELGRYEWRVLLFLKGIQLRGGHEDHVSVYVDVANSATLPAGWSRFACISFKIQHQVDPSLTVTKTTQHQFNRLEKAWGFTRFMAVEDLYDPGSGFVVNDTLIVKGTVTFMCQKRSPRSLRTGFRAISGKVHA